jgi:hypothetical protein
MEMWNILKGESFLSDGDFPDVHEVVATSA